MKIQPMVTNCIHISHGPFIVDFKIPYNIILIVGDAGTGKSMIYSFIEEYGTEDARIRCLNYLDCNKPYKKSIKRSKGKLFVIDNADVLLDDNMRQYIATDANNQYIIIGRNPTGLLLIQDNIYELVHTKEGAKTVFRLKTAF